MAGDAAMSIDFRLPRAQGHAINAVLSVMLWIVLANAAQTASRLLHH